MPVKEKLWPGPRRAGRGRSLAAALVVLLGIFGGLRAGAQSLAASPVLAWQDIQAAAEAGRRTVLLHRLGMPVTFTAHFAVYTVDASPDDAAAAGAAAETAWTELIKQVGAPAGAFSADGERIPLVVAGSYSDLGSLLGLQSAGATAGAEQDGVVYIVRPRPDGTTSAGGWAEVPLVHELVHYWLDKEAADRYPRWFTEGLAEYAQWQATGEVLPAPADWTDAIYRPGQIDRQFDSSDQAVAYREALSVVQFMAARFGPRAPWQVAVRLHGGESFAACLEDVTGGDQNALWAAWQGWLGQDMGAGVAHSP